jgi:hypothetical protein
MARAVKLQPTVLAALGALALGSVAFAQRGEFYRRPTPTSFDGSFNFCRIAYRAMGMDGGGWNVDYPRADENLSTRLSELTKVSISRDAWEQPNHLLLTLMDPELFRCPFTMLTEAGAAWFDEHEAAALRDYILKGGFLWADDFWGERAWYSWETELRKAFPSGEYPIHELPMEHALFRMVFQVKEVPQIPSINYWRGSSGDTSERHDSQVPRARAITDEQGRIMVLMTHNTDIGDSWEQEAQDPEYFERFSVYGYAFGINAVVYSMVN